MMPGSVIQLHHTSIYKWQGCAHLETGRYMLRSTNTGVSAIINEKGIITASSPQFIPHVTSDKVKTLKG